MKWARSPGCSQWRAGASIMNKGLTCQEKHHLVILAHEQDKDTTGKNLRSPQGPLPFIPTLVNIIVTVWSWWQALGHFYFS